MKLSDAAAGALAAIVGVVVVGIARTFPPMPGQSVGPALFPTVAGGGLIVFGALLMVTGRAARSTPWLEWDHWVSRPRLALNFLLVIASILFYVGVVDALGFLVTAVVFLAVLWTAFGVRPVWMLPLALAVALAIHHVFYSLFRVPLPWGVLGGVAW